MTFNGKQQKAFFTGLLLALVYVAAGFFGIFRVSLPPGRQRGLRRIRK